MELRGKSRGSIAREERHMTKANESPTLEPVAVRSDAGEARWWMGCLAVIKATAEETGGQMTVVEITEHPGADAPLHVHRREDEAFWVLEGDLTFEVNGTKIEAGPGDYLFGPRDIPHRYTVGDQGCRMLFIFTPGGFEDLIRKLSEPAAERTLPPRSDADELDLERIRKVAADCGAELLG
jgi:quercetin dioxygenase-like cupin family protein